MITWMYIHILVSREKDIKLRLRLIASVLLQKCNNALHIRLRPYPGSVFHNVVN